MIAVRANTSDDQLPRFVLDRIHRFDRVEDQIHEHLLKLHPIPEHRRDVNAEMQLKGDSIPLQLVSREDDDFLTTSLISSRSLIASSFLKSLRIRAITSPALFPSRTTR